MPYPLCESRVQQIKDTPPMTKIHVRWWIQADMPEVMAIEESKYEWDARTEQEFLSYRTERQTIPMVAELSNGKIVGYMAYELLPKRIHILCLEVHPDFLRQGVGTQMIHKLQNKLRSKGRTRISACIR